MRWVVFAIGISVLGCRKTAERTAADPPVGSPPMVTASAPIAIDASSPAVTLPPADELGPVRGNLSGKPFAVAKAVLWVSPQGARLSMYGKAEGEACSNQFAPNPDDLYVELQLPAEHAHAGGAVTHATERTIAIWKKPTYDHVEDTFALVIDDYAPAAGTFAGRVELRGADGTEVRGAVTGALCVSPQRPLPPGALHGRAWGDEPAVASLPRAAVEMLHVGTPGAPAVVELVEASASGSTQHELHFFRDAPAKPCEPGFFVPGFNVALGQAALARGLRVEQGLTLAHAPGKPFGVVVWKEPGGAIGMEGNGAVAVTLDKVEPARVSGRVFARFDDPAKSLLVGAFTATRCR